MNEQMKPEQDRKDGGEVCDEHIEVPVDPGAKKEPPPKMVIEPELERLKSSQP